MAGCAVGTAFESLTYTKDLLHQPQAHETQRLIFEDREVSKISTPEARFCLAASNPLTACLACIQLVTECSDGNTMVGDPLLTILNAPLAAPAGAPMPLRKFGWASNCSSLSAWSYLLIPCG